MQVVFINECKSCEISNQMFFSVMFSFLKTKDKHVMTYLNQVRLMNRTSIQNSVQHLQRSVFANVDVQLGFKYASVNITLHLTFFQSNIVCGKLINFLKVLPINKILSLSIKDMACNSPDGLLPTHFPVHIPKVLRTTFFIEQQPAAFEVSFIVRKEFKKES